MSIYVIFNYPLILKTKSREGCLRTLYTLAKLVNRPRSRRWATSLASPSSHSRMNTEVLEHQVSCPYPFGCVRAGMPVHISGFLHYLLVLPPYSPSHPSFFLLSPRFTGSWGPACRSAPCPITVPLCSRGCDLLCSVSELLAYFCTLFQKFVKIM